MKTGKQSIEESLNIDLEWDDKHVFPPVINPDLAFLYQRMGEATMEKMEVSGGENMLDIGCGRAIDVVELARRGGRCVGLEPSKSMINLAKRGIADTDAEVSLIQGIGEYLPFRTGSLNKVMCKGALDHFPYPAKTIEEMARVLKPDGKVIIVLANFESLGFKLGRGFHLIKGILFRKKPEERQVWEIPPDHTVRFDYALLRQLVNSHLKVERSIGISLLLGSPGWALLLAKLPKRVSLAILTILDKLARHLPSISDVVLLKCISKPESKAERQFLEESI
jgi:SAM-dependent methyltransferase